MLRFHSAVPEIQFRFLVHTFTPFFTFTPLFKRPLPGALLRITFLGVVLVRSFTRGLYSNFTNKAWIRGRVPDISIGLLF